MISRVGAALAQLIKPVASSTSQAGPRPSREFERFREKPSGGARQGNPSGQDPGRDPKQGAQEAQVIPFPRAENAPKAGPTTSVAHSFILLRAHFQQSRLRLFRWLGLRSYQQSLAEQRRLGKYRKGAMLDRKAE